MLFDFKNAVTSVSVRCLRMLLMYSTSASHKTKCGSDLLIRLRLNQSHVFQTTYFYNFYFQNAVTYENVRGSGWNLALGFVTSSSMCQTWNILSGEGSLPVRRSCSNLPLKFLTASTPVCSLRSLKLLHVKGKCPSYSVPATFVVGRRIFV